MARPREFDEASALEAALLVFWRKGFAATTIRELAEATGLGRQSLYNTFGDKRALFVASLELYRRRIDADLERLRDPDAGLQQVRVYIEGAVQSQRALGSGACMLVATAFGPTIDDPEIASAVRGGARSVRTALAGVVARGVQTGSIAEGTSPRKAAAMLYSLLNGLSALARTGGTAADRAAVLDHALESLT